MGKPGRSRQPHHKDERRDDPSGLQAEHAVDLESGLIVAAEIYPGTAADARTLEDTVQTAQGHLLASGSDVEVRDIAGDKGYYSADTVETLATHTNYRTYLAEPQLPAGQTLKWTHKPAGQRRAVYANRRRVRGTRGRRLQRLRSERVERTFAHVCENGGARRTWLRGIDKVRKRYLLAAAAHNLSCLMRELFGMGTPRGLQGAARLLAALFCAWRHVQMTLRARIQHSGSTLTHNNAIQQTAASYGSNNGSYCKDMIISTGC
jgi:transposase